MNDAFNCKNLTSSCTDEGDKGFGTFCPVYCVCWWWWWWWWWWIIFVIWLTDERRLCFTSSWDHCQRFSPSQISNTMNRVWTCTESEFRLRWMKLCSSDNHYTMAPQNLSLFWETYKQHPLDQQKRETLLDMWDEPRSKEKSFSRK